MLTLRLCGHIISAHSRSRFHFPTFTTPRPGAALRRVVRQIDASRLISSRRYIFLLRDYALFIFRLPTALLMYRFACRGRLVASSLIYARAPPSRWATYASAATGCTYRYVSRRDYTQYLTLPSNGRQILYRRFRILLPPLHWPHDGLAHRRPRLACRNDGDAAISAARD